MTNYQYQEIAAAVSSRRIKRKYIAEQKQEDKQNGNKLDEKDKDKDKNNDNDKDDDKFERKEFCNVRTRRVTPIIPQNNGNNLDPPFDEIEMNNP